MKKVLVTLASLTSWRRYGLSFLAGAFSVLSQAPFHFWPILLITVPVIVWQLDGIDSARKEDRAGGSRLRPKWTRAELFSAALVGWSFGFGYFLFGLYWIGSAFLVEAEKFAWLMPFAISLLPAGLAIFYSAAITTSFVMWRPGAARIFALAATMTLAEWLRGHILTGFPWNALGYALTYSESLMQWSSVFGVYGLTFFAVLGAGLPATLIEIENSNINICKRRDQIIAGSVVMIFMAGLVIGHLRIKRTPTEFVEGVRLRIVQPNIPQTEKWKPQNKDWIRARYLDLSKRGAALVPQSLEGITLIIWPEVALPTLLARDDDTLAGIRELIPAGTSLITGAIRIDQSPADDQKPPKRQIFNSLYIIDHEGTITQTYDKTHLVPFGEYLPFQNILEALGLEQLTRIRGGFSSGDAPTLLKAKDAPPFSPLICYEIIFPGKVKPEGTRPAWLLNVTNDAWFGNSSGPYQHFHQARVRAAEEGLPVVRAANNGISAVIDPYGRIVQELKLNETGIIASGLPKALGTQTWYATFGDWMVLGLVALSFILYLLTYKEE